MNSKRLIIGVLVLVLISGIGLVSLGVLGAPSVADMHNSFGNVSDEETEIESDLIIDNPNPIGVSAESLAINYSVDMNEIHMATGGVADAQLESGNTTVPLTSTLNNGGITDWWVSHVDNGEQTQVDVDVTITSDWFNRSVDYTHTTSIETDILADFRSDEPREIEANHPLVSDPILYINETNAEWGAVSETETPIEKEFLVYNPNDEPYVITRLGYDISMNEVSVGEGETATEYVIPGHSSDTIALTTAIDATTLDEWWVTHLDEEVYGHQVSQMRIEFSALVELPSGDTIELELDELTYEEFIGTDIFDEGGDVGTTPDDKNEGRDDATDGDDETGDSQPDDGSDDASDADGDTGDDNGSDDDETDDDLVDDDDGVL